MEVLRRVFVVEVVVAAARPGGHRPSGAWVQPMAEAARPSGRGPPGVRVWQAAEVIGSISKEEQW